MGNGPRLDIDDVLSVDIETRSLQDEVDSGALTLDMLEKAALAATKNFGKPQQLIFPMGAGTTIFRGALLHWDIHPEFAGTGWAAKSRLSKRERAFAHLQVFLIKFGLQKHLQDDNLRKADFEYAEKRLKRAKWAKYQQSKQT